MPWQQVSKQSRQTLNPPEKITFTTQKLKYFMNIGKLEINLTPDLALYVRITRMPWQQVSLT